jgi:hypothetical protein
VSLPSHLCLAALALSITLSGCRRLDERMEIKETRDISAYASPVVPIVPSAERFESALKEMEENEAKPAPQNLFSWVTPEGWQEAGFDPTGMRFINLQFGSHGEGECYLSLMPGKAGGLDANANRWRSQMGKQAFTPEELAALPKKRLLNRDATYLDIEGDFKGVGATEAEKNYRMVGLILPAPEFTLFVKMTGPKDVVDKNLPNFEKFVQSISPAR